ncbi:hypothetical protein [Halomonas dongshanensis]|uniref:Uncharacterized protein n=1 Tax=Halomonas dongshanensis TaxID=2890835 RepID=A0ABT2EHP7_9GAMM|nr:hypothetical protein [Halomonas dongshanensis]MCS2611070.1 hypothetical protein [Halomonas dongshanensis]
MTQITLSQPSTLVYNWVESDNRCLHTLWVQVDTYIITEEVLAWVDGESLQSAIDGGELPAGTQPNWFHVLLVDEKGAVDSVLMGHETCGGSSATGPVERFIEHQIQEKLERLRKSGRPSAYPLQQITIKSLSTDSATPLRYRAEACLNGVLLNPVLPASVGEKETGLTLREQMRWLNRPYIISNESEAESIFDVFCFDDSAIGSVPSRWGRVDTLEAALEIIRCKTNSLDPLRELYELQKLEVLLLSFRDDLTIFKENLLSDEPLPRTFDDDGQEECP